MDIAAKQLYGAHLMIAALFQEKSPEIAALIPISEKESELLAGNLLTLQEIYGVKPNPLVSAWISLGMTVAMIYGPKYLLLKQYLKKEG